MILFFEPIPRYTIWGGKACNQYFHKQLRIKSAVRFAEPSSQAPT